MEPLVIAIKSARERSAFAWRRAVLAAPSPGAAHGVILDSRACDRNYYVTDPAGQTAVWVPVFSGEVS